MDVSNYVAYRMLSNLFELPSRNHNQYEAVFEHLMKYTEQITLNDNGLIFYSFPRAVTTIEQLRTNMMEIFRGIMTESGISSLTTLRCLFIASYYLMIKHRHNFTLCAYIPYIFDSFTASFQSWRDLQRHSLRSNN